MSPPLPPHDLALLNAALEHVAEGGAGEMTVTPPAHVISEYIELRVRVRREYVTPRLPLVLLTRPRLVRSENGDRGGAMVWPRPEPWPPSRPPEQPPRAARLRG